MASFDYSWSKSVMFELSFFIPFFIIAVSLSKCLMTSFGWFWLVIWYNSPPPFATWLDTDGLLWIRGEWISSILNCYMKYFTDSPSTTWTDPTHKNESSTRNKTIRIIEHKQVSFSTSHNAWIVEKKRKCWFSQLQSFRKESHSLPERKKWS